MSAILGGSYAEPVARTRQTYRIAGFLPARRRGRAGRAQLQPRRVRAHALRQHRSVLLGQPDVCDDAGGRDRGRGGVLSDARAAVGPHAQGRALLLRLRLPERVPRARLGLRRSAARLPGLLRRPARAGRRAAQVAGADGPLSRARRGIRQRRRLSRHAARRQRPQRHDAVRARRRRHRRLGELARRRCRGSTCAPRIAPTRTSTRSAIAVENAFTGDSRTWIADATFKWARPATRCAAASSCRANTCSAPRTVSSRSTSTGAALGGRLSQRAGRLVRAGRVPVHAALARRRALRRARFRDTARSGWSSRER